MLEVWNWQIGVRRAGCLLLWEGETLSEEVSEARRPGGVSSARVLAVSNEVARAASDQLSVEAGEP